MRKLLFCAALPLALAACDSGESEGSGGPPPRPLPVTMADRPNATGGEQLFVEKCLMCHGDFGMGTGLLARRMEQAVAKLEDRGDLTADYVITAARMGIGNMPAIPRGEVSDDQLQQIADYLAGAGE